MRAGRNSHRRRPQSARLAVRRSGSRRWRAPWPEAVCSSLTELFAPEIHKQRLANWPDHYPWIDRQGLHYFQSRISLARRDVEFGLALTLDRFRTAAQQQRALEVLQLKLDILWQMNDALALRYGVSA